eukprot:CRZ07521.1 hypothetical protein [Spongospora subterranea]
MEQFADKQNMPTIITGDLDSMLMEFSMINNVNTPTRGPNSLDIALCSPAFLPFEQKWKVHTNLSSDPYTTRTKMQLKKQTSSPKTSVPSTNPWTPVRFNSNALSRTFRAQDTLQVFKILTAANDCCSSYVFLRDVVKSARLPHHDHAFTFDLPDSASD